MDTPYIVQPDLLHALPEVSPDSILSRSIYKDARTDVTLFRFAAGQELSEHRSPAAAVIQVLEGELKLTLGGDEVTVKTGAWVYMPPNLPHSLYIPEHCLMLLSMLK